MKRKINHKRIKEQLKRIYYEDAYRRAEKQRLSKVFNDYYKEACKPKIFTKEKKL